MSSICELKQFGHLHPSARFAMYWQEIGWSSSFVRLLLLIYMFLVATKMQIIYRLKNVLIPIH